MVELKKKITLKEKHESPFEPQPPTPSSNWWKWLVSALVVLIFVGGFYWYANKSNMTESAPAKIVSDSTNIDSSKESKTDTTKEQQASDALQNTQNGETNVSNVNSVPNKKPNANTEPVSVEKIKSEANAVVNNVESKAIRVIRGDFGNGSVRKQKLGSEYTSIQNKVNEMYRTGAVR